MENTAFCNGILKFYEQIDENVTDIEKAINNINTALSNVAKDIRLARATLSIMIPSNCFEYASLNKNGDFVFSFEEYDADRKIVKDFHTRTGGRVVISFYPLKGEVWNESEMSVMGHLAKNCYIIVGNARALSLMEKSLYTDRMTGADNIDSLMKFGGILAATGKLSEYSGVYLNLKNFKYVNKAFGSRQGDMLLRSFSQAMSSFIGGDGKFARLGGDNFSLIIKKNRMPELLEYLNKLSFEMGEDDEKQLYDVKFRMGIYETADGDTMSDIMNKSSIAYNAARADEHRNIMLFTPALMEEALHKKEISTLFPKSLENGEFVVYYQPKVRLSDNKLCGCEALCRWVRNGKIVPPMDFIPVLEREGTICKLDFYVFEAICVDIKRWIEMGIEPVRVSVNFSKRHLHNKKLSDQIIHIIQKYGIDSKYIEIELTEMTTAEDFTAMYNFVNIMKENGIATSIDDFGTGYSSLNLLKDLDVDVIKLDKSFFTNIDNADSEASTDRIVVKNIVNMVNELNMEAVSEGVETHGQAKFLRENNCCMAQGFLFDRPLPKDEFEKRLSDADYYVDKG